MDQDSGVDQADGTAAQQPSSDAASRGDVSSELTARQREMLDFERTWWQSDEPRDDLIRARFGVSTDEYYVELNQVLDLPGAMEHDPLVVRRFQRRRARRRRTLSTSSNVSQRGVSE